MSWAYVPASAGWSLGCTSPSREQIQSFLLSKIHSASPFCSDAGLTHSSGTTCSLSTVDHGTAASMFLRPASPVSPGALPASASASRMSGGSSRRSASSFARWSQSGSSWRMFQLSLLEEGLPLFSGHWPTSGMMQAGECFPASNWAPATSASGYSSWPTPKACNADKGGRPRPNDRGDLCASAKGWPTPCASTSGGNRSPSPGAAYRPSLDSIGKLWNTPTACEDEGTGFRTRGDAKLKGHTKQWQTPIATDATGSPNYADGTLRLTGQVKNWPTATARDWKSGKSNQAHNARPLSEVVERCGPQDQEPNGETSRANSGRLNSRFVEWLMGFPEGWTTIRVSANSWRSQTEEVACEHWETQCRHLLAQWLGES